MLASLLYRHLLLPSHSQCLPYNHHLKLKYQIFADSLHMPHCRVFPLAIAVPFADSPVPPHRASPTASSSAATSTRATGRSAMQCRRPWPPRSAASCTGRWRRRSGSASLRCCSSRCGGERPSTVSGCVLLRCARGRCCTGSDRPLFGCLLRCCRAEPPAAQGAGGDAARAHHCAAAVADAAVSIPVICATAEAGAGPLFCVLCAWPPCLAASCARRWRRCMERISTLLQRMIDRKLSWMAAGAGRAIGCLPAATAAASAAAQ